nr:MAG TPA: hypothetical protein [Caudoviricetes sp.]
MMGMYSARIILRPAIMKLNDCLDMPRLSATLPWRIPLSSRIRRILPMMTALRRMLPMMTAFDGLSSMGIFSFPCVW